MSKKREKCIPPECCPECGANEKQEGNMCLLYECGTIVYTDGHVAVSMECQANQLADYRRALEDVVRRWALGDTCQIYNVNIDNQVDRELAEARAARLRGEE